MLFCALPMGLSAQTATLQDCIRQALQQSPELRKLQALQQERTVKADRQKTQNLYPQITSRLTYSWYWNDLPFYYFPSEQGEILGGPADGNAFPVALGVPHNFFAGISLRQPIYNHAFWLGKDGQAQLNTVNTLEYARKQSEVIYEVARQYYKLQGLFKKQRMVAESMGQLQQLEQVLALQVKQGVVLEEELLNLQLRSRELQLRQRQLDMGIGQSTDYLKVLIGDVPDASLPVVSEGLPDWVNGLDSLSAGEALELELLEQQQSANLLALRVKQAAQYYPTAALTADFGWQSQQEKFTVGDWRAIHLLGVDIAIPIYAGGSRKKERQEVELQNQQIAIDQEKYTSLMKIQESAAMERMLQQREALAIAEGFRELAERKLQIARQQYEKEVLMLTDLLQARRQAEEAALSYEEAANELVLSALEVLKAKNQLTVLEM